MRTAGLRGLTADGGSLIVATDRGEEFAVAVDDRLRAALRGDAPRLGQLEIEMDNALTPREIQTRIRAGQSLEDVGRVAGLPADRVERFAAPVLAERDHLARLAMRSSVRRRGETSATRTLQATLTERLRARGVDTGTLRWDAYRREDGRWTVTAQYRSGEASRCAEFRFDPGGRFSVADNDDARWSLGEQSPAHGPQPGRRRPDGPAEDAAGTEPTLDLNDELALVRAVSDPPADAPLAGVHELRPTSDDPESGPAETPASGAESSAAAAEEPEHLPPETTGSTDGGPDHSADESQDRRGLSDAAAVPDTVDGSWEPAAAAEYPVEPSPAEPSPVEPSPVEPSPVEPSPVEANAGDAEPGPGELEAPSAEAPSAEAPSAGVPAEPATPRSTRRKRATIPSWDDIMFGGPKRPS